MIEIQEIDFFAVIGDCPETLCPGCGQRTRAYVVNCESCGGLLGSEEASLNLCEGRRPPMHKTPMQEADNLIRLQQAGQALAGGQIEVEDFLAEVDEVLIIVESALDLYESDFMRRQISTMEPSAAQIYHRIATAAAEMEFGLRQLSHYRHGQPLSLIEAGLKRVEGALWKVDAAQDVALEMGRQC
ncbi:hypothetical protein IV102_26035 [bacterium]|nr:hypothetical protein [bacterium]